MTKTVNIIGAGKVGMTIGFLLANSKEYKIEMVWNRSQDASNRAMEFIRQGMATQSLEDIKPADITFITTSDSYISSCFSLLLKTLKPRQGDCFIHCSGALSSQILSSATQLGAEIASSHPMKSFADPGISAQSFTNTFCAVEGSRKGMEIAKELFKSIGGRVFNIHDNKKNHYHASGVFASNYLATLFSESLKCLKHAGVEEDISKEIIFSLMRGTLDNIETQKSVEKALTGPIKRNDKMTIKNHAEALRETNQHDLYSFLGTRTIPLTDHEESDKKELDELLHEFFI